MEDLKKLSIAELRERAQSSAPEAGRDPWVGLTIRFFSIYITRLLLKTNITANQVTALSVGIFLFGAIIFSFHSFIMNFVGVFLIYFSIILDGCDGEIARLKFPKNNVGSIYTEPVSHDIQYSLLFIPLTVGAYFVTGSILIIYVGFGATVAKLLYRFISTRLAQLLFWQRIEKDNFIVKKEEHRIKFEKNVNIFHKFYRFVNRNFFSSVGMVIPLLFFSIINRMDLFIWSFFLFYLVIFLVTFFSQISIICELAKNNYQISD